MTTAALLRALQHVPGTAVLCDSGGRPVTHYGGTELVRFHDVVSALQDAGRFHALVTVAVEGQERGEFMLLMVGSATDAPWASVQVMRHDNPSRCLWIREAATLAEAVDAMPITRSAI